MSFIVVRYHMEMSSVSVEVKKEEREQKETLKADRIDVVKQDQLGSF